MYLGIGQENQNRIVSLRKANYTIPEEGKNLCANTCVICNFSCVLFV